MANWMKATEDFLISYRSRKTGGTLTEVRKTREGRDKLVRTLLHMGYKLSDINETVIPKPWKPDPELIKENRRKNWEKRQEEKRAKGLIK